MSSKGQMNALITYDGNNSLEMARQLGSFLKSTRRKVTPGQFVDLTWPEMSEREQWDRLFVRLLTSHGWEFVRFHDDRRSRSGYPDFTIAKCFEGGEVVVMFVELKQNNTHLNAEQRRWMEYLTVTGTPYFVWRPRDAYDITQIVCVSFEALMARLHMIHRMEDY